jgi:hypothetical protein
MTDWAGRLAMDASEVGSSMSWLVGSGSDLVADSGKAALLFLASFIGFRVTKGRTLADSTRHPDSGGPAT